VKLFLRKPLGLAQQGEMTVKVPLQIFSIGVFVPMQRVVKSLGQRRVIKHRPIGHMQHFAGMKVIQNSGQIGIRQLRNGRQPFDFSRHMIDSLSLAY